MRSGGLKGDWEWPLLLTPAPGLGDSDVPVSKIVPTFFPPEPARAETVAIHFARQHPPRQNEDKATYSSSAVHH